MNTAHDLLFVGAVFVVAAFAGDDAGSGSTALEGLFAGISSSLSFSDISSSLW